MKHILTMIGAVLCLAVAAPAFAVQELIQTGATTPIPFLLVDAATGQIGQTGQTSNITVTVAKPGTTSYVASAGTITEVGNGLYYYTPTSAETTQPGTTQSYFTLIHVTDTTDSTQVVDTSAEIVGFNPNAPSNLGLTSLPTANPASSGGLPTVGTSTGQVSPSGGTFTGVGLATTQAGVTIPTVTNVTNSVVASSVTGAVGSVTAAITLPANAPSTFLANDTTVGTINTNTTASAQATDTQTGLTNQGLTTSLASGLLTTNTDVPLIYAKNPAFTPLINSSGYMTATNGGGGGGTDPWLTPLPGAYTAGEAGYIVGNNLNAPISGVPSASSIATAVWSGTGVTIPASHSSSGSSFTLTYRQWLIVSLSVLNGDSANSAPSASSSATQNYYEIGQPIGTGTLVAQSTATFSASTVISGRTIIFQAQDASL